MHRFAALALSLLLPAAAWAAPPSDEQVDRLLELAGVERELERMLPQLEATQEQMVRRMLPQPADPEREAAASRALEASRQSMRRMLAWERLRPLYLDIYRRSYEAEDLEAIIAFYQSPAGQRLLEKQPVLVQNTLAAIQGLVEPELLRLRDELAELAAPASGG